MDANGGIMRRFFDVVSEHLVDHKLQECVAYASAPHSLRTAPHKHRAASQQHAARCARWRTRQPAHRSAPRAARAPRTSSQQHATPRLPLPALHRLKVRVARGESKDIIPDFLRDWSAVLDDTGNDYRLLTAGSIATAGDRVPAFTLGHHEQYCEYVLSPVVLYNTPGYENEQFGGWCPSNPRCISATSVFAAPIGVSMQHRWCMPGTRGGAEHGYKEMWLPNQRWDEGIQWP